jgi:hypothetical protein
MESSPEDGNESDIALERLSTRLFQRVEAMITERFERATALPRSPAADAVRFGSRSSSHPTDELFTFKEPIDLIGDDRKGT